MMGSSFALIASLCLSLPALTSATLEQISSQSTERDWCSTGSVSDPGPEIDPNWGPRVAQLARTAPSSVFQGQSDARININTASPKELKVLPGIGPTLAERIVEHRRKYGPFKRPQEIIIVQGMSASRYRRIAHLIRI